MKFPKVLDEASVLYYTPPNCYGTVCYVAGEIADLICYLAIGQYEHETQYYLFGCNAEYEVVSDSPWESIEECMRVAQNSYDCTITWIAMT